MITIYDSFSMKKMGYPTKYEWELNHWILNIIDLFNVKLDVNKKKKKKE